MSMKFILLIALPCLIQATPLLRELRQSSACRDRQDCLSTADMNVTDEFVNCVEGECVCQQCFFQLSGICTTCKDYIYSPSAQDCGNDDRPRRLTALLLSIFLSSTGAANFYIGQNNLGGGQLFLLLLTFAISYFMCCFPCCLGCCIDEPKKSLPYVCVQLLTTLLTLSVALCTFSWWIADIVIFAQNSRLSGNGCVLA